MNRDVELVVQTVMSDNHSNPSTALIDLAHRYVALSRSVCPGYSRWGMNIQTRELKPDAPAVCDDEWIKMAF